MLAYHPGFNTSYDINLTVLSLLMAVVVTACGLAVAVYGGSRWSGALGGGLVGGGVASMHYIGIWAMYLPGWIMWQIDLVVASILLGMLLGAAAIAVAVHGKKLASTLAAALLLTLAIISHHFTAMGAVLIIPDPTRTVAPLSLSSNGLALGVAATAFVLFAMALVGALPTAQRKKRRASRTCCLRRR